MERKRLYDSLIGLGIAAILCVGALTLASRKERRQQAEPLTLFRPKASPLSHQSKTARKAEPKPGPAPSLTLRGTLRDTDDNPMAGVVVSDGMDCVVTDSAGNYALRRNGKARFVYYSIPADCEVPTHSATDNTAFFYKAINRKDSVYDFTLSRLPDGKETSFKLIVFGDPQVTNAFSPYYTGPNDNPVQKSDVARFTDETMVDVKQTIADWPASTPVYGISMGDDVQYYGGYNATLERRIREALGASTMKVFSVIGNHDQDGKPLYKRKWEENWGPTDYSFDRGDIHFVCFNNVHFYKGATYYQPGELTDSQLRWLEQDLRLADHSKRVILCYHIPLTFGTRPHQNAAPLAIASEQGHYSSSRLSAILKLLEDFKGGSELFCGHTHFAINHEIAFEGRHLLEHCHAAACGNIWQSNINLCGTPNGYYVYSMQGTHISDAYYKGTFWKKEKQMSLFLAGTDFNGEQYATDWDLPRNKRVIIANVFNADSRWRVVAMEDGVEYEMNRISSKGQDAFAAGYHHKYSKSVSYNFVSKRNGYLLMNHLYWYEPKSPTSLITIRAKDGYGNVYTASSSEIVTQPFFNYAHFYNHPPHCGAIKREAGAFRARRKGQQGFSLTMGTYCHKTKRAVRHHPKDTFRVVADIHWHNGSKARCYHQN